MKRIALGLLCGFALCRPLGAQQLATPADLPSTDQAAGWIDRDAAVAEARAALAAAGHAGAALAAGPHEWNVKAAAQRRSYRGGGDSQEWSAQLERSIRINGKGELDRQLGEVGLEIAQAKVSQVRGETARTLAELWLDWLAAVQAQELLTEQLSFAEASLRTVEVRQRAGDASALDVNVVRTDVAEAQRQTSRANSALAKAKAKLRVRFPEAVLLPRPMSDPATPSRREEEWRERILDQASLLRVARSQLRKAELTASRTRADRVPDPTLGVYTATEAFRSERVVGISISIPLSGRYREAQMLQSLREVEMARAALDRQRRDLETEVAESYVDSVGAAERWRLAERGRASAGETSRLMQRAYALGEADLQALLLARRQSSEASRAAVEARLEALKSHYRLLVDARLIWDLDRD